MEFPPRTPGTGPPQACRNEPPRAKGAAERILLAPRLSGFTFAAVNLLSLTLRLMTLPA